MQLFYHVPCICLTIPYYILSTLLQEKIRGRTSHVTASPVHVASAVLIFEVAVIMEDGKTTAL